MRKASVVVRAIEGLWECEGFVGGEGFFSRSRFSSSFMAKIGEGDPRWIVSERQDGRNVNQWHWYVMISKVFCDRIML